MTGHPRVREYIITTATRIFCRVTWYTHNGRHFYYYQATEGENKIEF